MIVSTDTALPAGHQTPMPVALGTGPRPAMPDESRLKMPVQSLSAYEKAARKPKVAGGTWLARLVIFGGALALTCYGAWQMYKVVSVGGTTTLEWALLVLFVANFSWIALAFTSSLVGFVWMLFLAPRRLGIPEALSTRTAIVMPIYNESPERVFAALEAMYEEVQATGLGSAFEWFFLSDTTNPDVFVAEEAAFLKMRERLGPQAILWYRHRPQNTARKAGNIADFVTRWGGRYENMLVLDADSLMLGHAMVNLAAAMEADPNAGIIQTLPLIINRNTLFARLQQFAARIYGPVIAAGLSTWMGRDGNYWGHNAIIRTRAFADHCGLPHLQRQAAASAAICSEPRFRGSRPDPTGRLGRLPCCPVLGGSFEESPPSLIDLAARDRRWCQGNLQHCARSGGQGLSSGVAPALHRPASWAMWPRRLWMAQLLVGIDAGAAGHLHSNRNISRSDFSLFPAWPRFDAQRGRWTLFGDHHGRSC